MAEVLAGLVILLCGTYWLWIERDPATRVGIGVGCLAIGGYLILDSLNPPFGVRTLGLVGEGLIVGGGVRVWMRSRGRMH